MAHVSLKELAYRERDGLEVALVWDVSSNELCVDVRDVREEQSFRLPVSAEHALDAFNHPFAYAASDERTEYSVLA
jgi:hypothetical protein